MQGRTLLVLLVLVGIVLVSGCVGEPADVVRNQAAPAEPQHEPLGNKTFEAIVTFGENDRNPADLYVRIFSADAVESVSLRLVSEDGIVPDEPVWNLTLVAGEQKQLRTQFRAEQGERPLTLVAQGKESVLAGLKVCMEAVVPFQLTFNCSPQGAPGASQSQCASGASGTNVYRNPECTCWEDALCSGDEACYGFSECRKLDCGACSAPSAHVCRAYECCTDSDCSGDSWCEGNACRTEIRYGEQLPFTVMMNGAEWTFGAGPDAPTFFISTTESEWNDTAAFLGMGSLPQNLTAEEINFAENLIITVVSSVGCPRDFITVSEIVRNESRVEIRTNNSYTFCKESVLIFSHYESVKLSKKPLLGRTAFSFIVSGELRGSEERSVFQKLSEPIENLTMWDGEEKAVTVNGTMYNIFFLGATSRTTVALRINGKDIRLQLYSSYRIGDMEIFVAAIDYWAASPEGPGTATFIVRRVEGDS